MLQRGTFTSYAMLSRVYRKTTLFLPACTSKEKGVVIKVDGKTRWHYYSDQLHKYKSVVPQTKLISQYFVSTKKHFNYWSRYVNWHTIRLTEAHASPISFLATTLYRPRFSLSRSPTVTVVSVSVVFTYLASRGYVKAAEYYNEMSIEIIPYRLIIPYCLKFISNRINIFHLGVKTNFLFTHTLLLYGI